jgi:hypothetical protein
MTSLVSLPRARVSPHRRAWVIIVFTRVMFMDDAPIKLRPEKAAPALSPPSLHLAVHRLETAVAMLLTRVDRVERSQRSLRRRTINREAAS